MDRNEAASIIKRYITCTDIMNNCNGQCTLCRYYPSDEEKESALKLAIEALEQPEIIRCRDCKYSVDQYNDGTCYCKRPSRELVWIGRWDFFCKAGTKREGE